MMDFFSVLIASVAAVLAIPVATFLVEIIAAIAPPRRAFPGPPRGQRSQQVAVIVPAHNESTALLPTLADIKAQIGVNDRLLVVADNCSDDTATVAAAAGAEVVERNEPERKGKGYALASGIKHLEFAPPDIVIIVDADCRLPEMAIDNLALTSTMTNRPVQSLSSMITRDGSPINTRVAEFAWLVKNYVRPRGLSNLGFPCQLMGSGMAFPWNVIRTANLASSSLVEDLKLGLELAIRGDPPIFCPFPGVTSEFPSTVDGLKSQRQRWETGHIATILALGPQVLRAAFAQGNLSLLAMALDLAIPPLSMLAMLVIGMLAIASLANFIGLSPTAMQISLISLTALVGACLLSWLQYGRKILPASSLVLVIPYVFKKFSLYRNILLHKSNLDWIRTDRTKI
jgi:cellulose synthase/poly-beta-1,6-N-acetylglucosamine synthase-like glycosyltransferase